MEEEEAGEPVKPSPSEEDAKDHRHAPAVAAKPKPAPRPRHKPPVHRPEAEGAAEMPERPQAAPRHKRDHSGPFSPERTGGGQTTPKHQQSAQELSLASHLKPARADSDSLLGTSSPKGSPARERRELLTGSPKQPILPRLSPKRGGEGEESSPKGSPQLLYRRQLSKEEEDDAKLEKLRNKDPWKLSVKEKALLAQKAISSTEKPKMPPPPVARKPKPHHDEEPSVDSDGRQSRERSRSFDYLEQDSPRRVRKLPPGAFNIGLPAVGPGAFRVRSTTVASTESDSRENSVEPLEEHQTSSDPRHRQEGVEGSQPVAKAPPKRPPPPVTRRQSDEKPASKYPSKHTAQTAELQSSQEDLTADTSSVDLLDETDQVDAAGMSDGGLNPEMVLVWGCDEVASWLRQIGLGQYHQLFTDKGIRGNMLFDLDGSKLKVSLISHLIAVRASDQYQSQKIACFDGQN